MIWQRVRVALLASIVAMAAALPLVNGGKAQAGSCGSCGSAGTVVSSTSAARAQLSLVRPHGPSRSQKWLPENYTTTRTVYRQQRVEEKYTAYKIERVPETRTRNVTVYEKVPVEEGTRTTQPCASASGLQAGHLHGEALGLQAGDDLHAEVR